MPPTFPHLSSSVPRMIQIRPPRIWIIWALAAGPGALASGCRSKETPTDTADSVATDSQPESDTDTADTDTADTDTNDTDVDSGDTACTPTDWFVDADGDGHGAGAPVSACEAPAGYLDSADDCDDTDPSVYPGAPTACTDGDGNCDGEPDNVDADGDHFLGCEECDDANAAANPLATETCNGVDDDCDGGTDEDAVGATEWFADADGDGYGGASLGVACDGPAGSVLVAGDCDDSNASVNPAAVEICNELDDDCDGAVDVNAADATTSWEDADGDGYGTGAGAEGCTTPAGRAADDGDCDDADPAVSPGAVEVCNGVDDDCDGGVDIDAVDTTTWFEDGDGDGFGDGEGTEACDAPAGWVEDDSDCDDADPGANPAGVEVCNDVDDDCDGSIDDDPADIGTWYIDYDGDGYGSTAYSLAACEAPAGWVASSDDCDDTEAAVHPLADEVCNGDDDDCDGTVDEDSALDAPTWYLDADGDGHGLSTSTTVACSVPEGYAELDDDCDDRSAGVHPDAVETCDGLDENCDGTADDGALGGDLTCSAASCQAILDDGSSTGDGLYWLDPDQDGDTTDAWQAWCDMTDDGGGWTRIYGSLYPEWWSTSDWEEVGAAEDDVYSNLAERDAFRDADGNWTFRLEVGNSDTWLTGPRAHYTVWSQGHDPFSDSTDGSDYTFIDGEESTTCGGFNGLHDQYFLSAGVHCMVSDVDSTDYVGCWWMQIIPLAQYSDATSYPGYLEGYGGPNTHVWHVLWVR